MRALLVGLGSIGRRHLSNLNSIAPASDITILRQPSKRDEKPEAKFNRLVFHIDEALAMQPEVALITGPSSLHVETALALARAGTHLFIEKPLSNSLDGVDELLAECRSRSLVLMVGYNFRFYKPLQILKQALFEGRIGRPLMVRAEAGQFLPDWRYNTDYRKSVSARSEMGGGVVLELSHELDYLRWLMGEPVTVMADIARLSDLEIDVEDTAQIILRFTGGAMASVHLDMLQRPPTRNCRITGTEGTLTWDGMTHEVRLFSAASGEWEDLHAASAIDRNEMYVAELSHFLDCVERREMPLVTGEDGRRVLEIALAAKRSSAEGRVIRL